MGVFELQDPVPVSVALVTVPLPVNSATLPFLSPATNIKWNAASAGTGFAATPIRTPWPVLFEDVEPPEIEPCPLLLLAIKQTDPCTENVPAGLATLQGLETNRT
jgi:hypothetical protein